MPQSGRNELGNGRGIHTLTVAGGGDGFSPDDIGWDLFAWAEGAAFAARSISDGSTTEFWDDEANGADFAQSTAGLRPTYRASDSGFNNQPVIDFAADWMKATNSAISAPISIVMVMSSDDSSQGAILDSPAPRHLFQRLSSTQWRWFNKVADTTVTSTTGAYFHVLVEATGGNKYLIDGTEVKTGTGTTDGMTASGMTLNATAAGTAIPNGNTKFGFVGVYPGDITADGSYDDLKTWVADHYGLTIA